MFEGKKYMTKGVQSDISLDLQLLMWQMIEDLRCNDIELDYLQVFNLKSQSKDNIVYQQIEHIQEVPEYKSEVSIKRVNPIKAKVFVITSKDEDGNEYSTMMLAEEY